MIESLEHGDSFHPFMFECLYGAFGDRNGAVSSNRTKAMFDIPIVHRFSKGCSCEYTLLISYQGVPSVAEHTIVRSTLQTWLGYQAGIERLDCSSGSIAGLQIGEAGPAGWGRVKILRTVEAARKTSKRANCMEIRILPQWGLALAIDHTNPTTS